MVDVNGRKRDLSLGGRDSVRRVCECGGQLRFMHVNANFLPVTVCMRCGTIHEGTKGTKVIHDT